MCMQNEEFDRRDLRLEPNQEELIKVVEVVLDSRLAYQIKAVLQQGPAQALLDILQLQAGHSLGSTCTACVAGAAHLQIISVSRHRVCSMRAMGRPAKHLPCRRRCRQPHIPAHLALTSRAVLLSQLLRSFCSRFCFLKSSMADTLRLTTALAAGRRRANNYSPCGGADPWRASRCGMAGGQQSNRRHPDELVPRAGKHLID